MLARSMRTCPAAEIELDDGSTSNQLHLCRVRFVRPSFDVKGAVDMVISDDAIVARNGEDVVVFNTTGPAAKVAKPVLSHTAASLSS